MPGRFFDTNILLYLLSDDHTKADIAEGLLRGGGTVSVQVLNEIATVTQRKFRMSWAQTDEFLLMIREFVTVEPLTYETHDLGIALARKHALSVYDAMIVAAGLLAGCDILLSEDMQDGFRVADRITIRNPFAAQI
ncbi:PIN domain-containing protein [Paracoccus tegillarcae]|uniref:VapC toxin family PIN domain ribonuclease n=1 Tax=Paracoccus tegillarcae TaxID=1529068 RepID=A0A2K9F228_9RHOB|nr:PIN domain-containing protein [Paracoccus tegillarcae]AUH35604.1 VapC toxin family PIN domain ribonuclease [Paracoccus tegillarcae]